MRFAYADPPYLGRGRKDYTGNKVEGHPEGHIWDDPQTHVDLCARLVDEYPDGWAVSLLPKSLPVYLNALPTDVRVAAYCKTWHLAFPNVPVTYAWEPVIFRGGRPWPGFRIPIVRDWIAISTQDRGNRNDGFKGSKPAAFNRWVIDLLNVTNEDTLDDLFPGTGGMGRELAQGVLL